ncbi:hypothetical protein DPMN_120017 [Dreissena polymorpha]|uniref:Uncharacterized protein n=1 Tax=Dreissena polymorpha TaxID=45954 RepID=A0A9D4JPV7_DREPO|nr:hypothetical protein DPMN_120017 [Dreissena polymorpha]
MKSVESSDAEDASIRYNLCIRNMPEREREDTAKVVNDLLHNGLQLPHISCVQAERKRGFNDKPGAIIFKVKSDEEKMKNLKTKK